MNATQTHRMESKLPYDVQSNILQRADIPIDSLLHFQKELGLVPKRLTDTHKPQELVAALNKICQHRVKCYKAKTMYERETENLSYLLVHFEKDLESPLSVEIMIDVDRNDNDNVKMAFRIHHTDEQLQEMWTLRKTVVNVHTGELTNDFAADSDDDF